MNFWITHTFRECNSSADQLATDGTSIQGLLWWETIPNFSWDDFFRNRWGISYFTIR